MARKSMTTLKSETNAAFPDNTTGEISPQDLRSTMIDFMDSMTPGYGIMVISTQVDNVSFTTTPQDITQWDTVFRQDPEFTCNTTTGVITGNSPLVWDFTLQLTLRFSSSDNMIFQTVFSESTFNYVASSEGSGSSDPFTLNLTGTYDGITNSTLKIQGFTDSGSATVDFVSGGLICRLVPSIDDA